MAHRALPSLLPLLLLAVLSTACTVPGGVDEEEMLSDAASDTSSAGDTTGTDTSPPDDDTRLDTTVPPDTAPEPDTSPQDVPDAQDLTDVPDAPRDTTVIEDTMDADVPVDPCVEPPRIAPDTVESAGHQTVWAYGQEFYIGALEWWLVLDGEVWIAVDYAQIPDPSGMNCAMPFRVPPLAPGDYAAAVVYGWPGSPDPVESPFTLHVEASTQHWQGGQSCGLSNDTCPDGQHCRLGLGFCVPDGCGLVSCDNGTDALLCDPLEGCRTPPPPCEKNSDCEMIYSPCGCMALHASDPRLQASDPFLTACELDACSICAANQCEIDALWPACDVDTGRCIEMPPL